ncbi:MAG: hypothetical protein K2X87_30495 [Gemmataceae bacterium]|nr:hypothetical protein [Gemmataceae bacterium]
MTERGKLMRAEARDMVRAVPFRPFFLMMENGERVLVEHPENIALRAGNEDGSGGSAYFYVLGNNLRVASTFDAVSSVVTLDQAEV